ncbi:CAP domain-containing protein [Cellulomonas sp. NPDC055163]
MEQPSHAPASPRRRELREFRAARSRRRRVRVRAIVVTSVALCTGALSAWATVPSLRTDGPQQTLAALPAAVSQLVDRGDDVSRGGGRRPQPSPLATATGTPTVTPEPSATDPAPEVQPTATPTATPTAAPTAQPSSPAAPPEGDPAPAPPEAPAPTADQQFAATLVTLTNEQRAAAGLGALTVSDCATQQAVARAGVLVAENRFEHDPLEPILAACGPGSAGENLALGYRTPADMMAGWMGSEGHRANILRAYSSIGIGCVSSSRGVLCAQVFLG